MIEYICFFLSFTAGFLMSVVLLGSTDGDDEE